MKHQDTEPPPPEAWLLVNKFGMVVGVFPSQDDVELLATIKKDQAPDWPLTVVLDEPSLRVWHYGCVITNPACLRARDNWFHRYRYEKVLEPHLRNPASAQVYTFEPGEVGDLLVTHKSTSRGPFAFPKGRPWPRCGFCQHELGFFGTLDFRPSGLPVPKGSLVVHVCTECGACSDRETWAATWLKSDDDLEIMFLFQEGRHEVASANTAGG